MSQNAVQYIKQDEPAFLKRFKEKVGYKEEPAIDAKRRKLESDDDDAGGAADARAAERDDEKPVVVVLQPGDLSADEAEKLNCNVGLTPGTVASDKIIFKKPFKKTDVESEPSGGSGGRAPPLPPGGDAGPSGASKARKEPTAAAAAAASKKEFSSKAVKNSSLLSFTEEDC